MVIFSMLQTGFVSMKLISPCQYILWILAVEIACPSWGESDQASHKLSMVADCICQTSILRTLMGEVPLLKKYTCAFES